MWNVLQDVKVGVRNLVRHPAGTVLAVIALALGIGANAAVYRFARAVLWRPLTVRDAGNVVTVLYGTDTRQFNSHAYADFEHYRDHAKTLAGVAASASTEVTVRTESGLENAVGEFVSPEYFPLLGVMPALGSLPLSGDRQGAEADIPVLLSDGFWRRRFGARSDVRGGTLQVNRRLATIVGVAPASYHGIQILDPPDIWLPLSALADVLEMPAASRALLFAGRGNESFEVIARLKSGVTITQAQTEVRQLRSQLDAEPGGPKGGPDASIQLSPIGDAQLLPQERAPIVDFMWVIVGGTVLTLLIACLNGTNILLARFLDRSREIATRFALGASRWMLVRQMMVEATIATVLGATAAIALSEWCTRWLGQVTSLTRASVRPQYGLDWGTVAFAYGLAVVLGCALGLFPALKASQVDLVGAIKAAHPIPIRRRWRASSTDLLLVGQVSVCVVLLVGAGLLLVSLHQALHVDLGFANRDTQVVALRFEGPSQGGAEKERARAYLELVDRVKGVPGVRAATVAAVIPLASRKMMRQVVVHDHEKEESIDYNVVASGYFETMGIRITRGRPIGLSDSHGQAVVAVVNETFAQRYWLGQDPLGKVFRLPSQRGEALDCQVVGVAEDGKYRDISEARRAFFYLALDQVGGYASANLIVWPSHPAGKVLAEVRAEVDRSSQAMAISGITSMAANIDRRLARQRLGSSLMIVASTIALVLTVIGIAAATGYAVTRRRAEIGVRLAVGATVGGIVRMLLLKGVSVITAGLVIGGVLALAAGRVLAALVFGVRSSSTEILALASVLVMVAGLGAVFFQARAVARIDPVEALRSV